MDVTGIGGSSSAALAARADPTSAVQLVVLKKVLDMESQNAQQLIQAVAQTNYNNPPNLGNNIDTHA
jgi:hypothetical protein